MWKPIARFLADENGPTAAEYAVILALIILMAFAAIATVGTQASTRWQSINNSTRDAGLGQ